MQAIEYMPQEIRLWEVKDRSLVMVERGKLSLEEQLEDWLEHDITMVSDDLLVIGRQVEVSGRAIDLLCLNSDGDVVIVELKKDKAPREVLAQALEYASLVEDLSYEDVLNNANNYFKQKGSSFEEAFLNKFLKSLPEVLNESHEILIVASELDDQTERVIKYLSQYGVRINAVTFNYFKKDGREFIARVLLIPESAREQDKGRKRRRNLSEEELRRIATDNGVGDLYIQLVEGLRPLFDLRGTTLSSIAFIGEQDEQDKTIFSLIPTKSSRENGLKFQVYIKRFAKHFNITEEEAEKILPPDKRKWEFFKNAPPDFQGYEGFFKNKDEAKAFTNKLQELKRIS